MSEPSLAIRVADFLKRFLPFSFLPKEELRSIAAEVVVQYYSAEEVLFEQGSAEQGYVYVIRKGGVELIRREAGESQLIDVCDTGDTFGVRAVMSGNPYLATARALEDSLVYALPEAVFNSLLENKARLALYFAAGFAAGQPVVHANPEEFRDTRRKLLFEKKGPTLFREEDILPVFPEQTLISCSADQSIQEAASILARHRIGALPILDEQRRPIGILTDVDLSRKVVAGDISRHEPVSLIMSSPVHTVKAGDNVASLILSMMRHHIRHLVVTEDGSNTSPVIGMISERDLLLMQGNNPAILIKRILKTQELDVLAEIRERADQLIHNYLLQEISIPFVAGVITEINDALIHRAIELSLAKIDAEGIPRPRLRFAWLSLGSEGRGEQLLRTDQDNALLYEDPAPGEEKEAAAYFLRLGEEVNQIIGIYGFAECPANIMARNPEWNQSLSGWKKHFSSWIHVPEPQALMHSAIFFDYRPTYGDADLVEQLTDHLYDEIEAARRFMYFFAQNASQTPPPLSFFKNLIVSKSREHKNKFDIKLRAMMPLTDAARVLCLHHKLRGLTNTFQRYERLAELEPQNAALYQEAAMAYELLMRYRALNGFAQKDSGRFIDPGSLNKIERKTLKYSFSTIEDVQQVMKSRFDLNIF